MVRPHLLTLVAALGVAVAAVAGCTSSGSTPPAASPDVTTASVPAGGATATTGTVPRTAPLRSTAVITRFDLPANIACHGLVTVKPTATYATTGASSVAFLVDNEQVGSDRIGTPPTSGSVELPLRCDGAAHTVVISAVDDQGRAAVMSRAVLTDDRESGG